MKHIYIVEDDEGIIEALKFLLEETYYLTAMNDARIALNKLRSEQPDLILLDLSMPNLDGVAFIKLFAKMSLKIPILVMSASTNIDAQLNHPAVAGIIHKPFQIDKMTSMIEQVLAKQS
jgi:two-component system response regulator (stage 0 sporulation protein F)